MTYRDLIDELFPRDWEITVGDDPENAGRFFAEARWDDFENRVHHSERVVNEVSGEEALRYLAETLQEDTEDREAIAREMR